MKSIIAFCLLSLVIGCTQKQSTPLTRSVSMYDVPLTDREAALSNPYELSFTIEKGNKKQYTLVAMMELFGGSFYVSPFSTTGFKGRFTIDLQENDHVMLGENFTETPRSKAEIDPHPYVNGLVNWVSVDTKYEYPLTILSEDDFEVRGKFVFTIEPKCTLEQVPFIIKYESGVLRIEKWLC